MGRGKESRRGRLTQTEGTHALRASACKTEHVPLVRASSMHELMLGGMMTVRMASQDYKAVANILALRTDAQVRGPHAYVTREGLSKHRLGRDRESGGCEVSSMCVQLDGG